MRLLLVEDDSLIGSGLERALIREGYEVSWCRDGAQAQALIARGGFRLVVLDLGLPVTDGMRLLRRWRGRGIVTPVLILTARDTTDDKIRGLDDGADDFLTKPFDLSELLARLRALTRRHGETTRLEAGDLQLDRKRMEARYAGSDLALSRREFVLLWTLLAHPGHVYSRERLEEALYEDAEVSSNAVEVHVHNLRRKIHGGVIQTVRGVGYKVPERP